jgi:hypothetical protein
MTTAETKLVELSSNAQQEGDGFTAKTPYAAPILVELDVDSTNGAIGPNFDGDFSPQS